MTAANGPDSSTLGHILWNWLSNSTASTSDDSATQIKCYAFPYGLLGFVAHLAMFYGIALSSFNRCPYNYRKPLQHSRRDLALGISGLIISCLLTAGTIKRCSGTKYYLLIASSKILMTFASSAVGIHIAWNIRGRGKLEDDDQSQLQITHHNTLRWLIIEVIGSILEFTGVIMLLKESHGAVAKNRTPIMVISLFLAGFIGIFLGIGITWLEVRQRAQRRMEWEIRKLRTKCAPVEERLAPEQPPGRSPNRQDTPNGEREAEDSTGPGPRQDDRRRSGRHDADQDARRESPSPVGRGRDIEAQGLIAPAGKDEPDEQPDLYHYQDVLNSAKQFVVVAGATFGIFVTL
ncbi:hypothetical protein INS49_007082 [Diaporthe citri]|uniref:uncharacterized protein n=1 Tax=Diaporthe citri TaxID=83186 RepID=UPI001C7EB71C|nr:uncharacterized protein INS49_007082 [Diaporthe citri]KAG6365471.1 hypothetical protein INS49_007082 [Diaporthe citri]